MYTSQLVNENCSNITINKVEELWQEAKKLSVDEKSELLQKLLEKESGLVVISANSHLVDYIVAQINLLSSEGLAYVLMAIAPRIHCD
jgi:hypothetical protein